MKFSERWLREWVNPPISTEQLVAQLTMAGLEVDSVTPVAPRFSNVVVGEVVSLTPHPEANKLKICQVNTGQAEPLTIVCGANNVAVGMRVPTALMGAQLPEGMSIQLATLRGITSYGMLCSAKELGLADTSEGLMPLPADAPLGEEVYRYLQLDDVSIEIDLTPNRGDCLSIQGVAREVQVLNQCDLTPVKNTAIAEAITDTFPVTIMNPQACPRYVGRVIKNVNAQAETPLWMKERLRRSGLRSISAIVDITNYLLLELGQPMHAFDLQKLNGDIQVRMARAGETLTLLDGQTVTLDEQTLVIADEQKPQAMAGVMGGLPSAVSATTTDIFLESAFFTPHLLAGSARRYGLHTDSSHRFERGVDPQLQRRATERATALLLDIVGGQPGPLTEVVDTTTLPSLPLIPLRATRITRLLGYSLAPAQIREILTRLGMSFQSETGETWHIQPPSFRFDVTIEADLIEELARIHGYHNLPIHAPTAQLKLLPQPSVTIEQIQSVLVQRGYQEAITYSFVDPQRLADLNPEVETIRLTNPISNDMAVMRTTLWCGLLQALLHNQNRQQLRVRLFEQGLCFIQTTQGIQQDKMLAGLASGACYPEQWGEPQRTVDFFDVKADVEALLNLTGEKTACRFVATQHPALHPGQTAAIYRGDQSLGLIGALHPSLLQKLEITFPVYLFELQLTPLVQSRLPKFTEISKYPSIRRDIALTVATTIQATEILTKIQQTAPNFLTEMRLFDVYQGKGIEVGKKSLAIGLIFQEFSRNLLESEVDTVMTQIISQLEQNLDAQLRK